MPRDFGDILPYLRCPICSSHLLAAPGALRCGNGHAFDIARRGYVNFAGSVSARSRERGDSAAMLAARQAFLNGGHFLPLVTTLRDLIYRPWLDDRANRATRLIVEPGCGTGYYLAELVQGCPAGIGASILGIGLDIAPAAVQLAARNNRSLFFFVADTGHQLPLATGSADVVLNAFSPRNPAEFARVARPSARLICVIPGPEHLAALRGRAGLIGIEPHKEANVVTAFADFSALVDRVEVRFDLHLRPEVAVNLVAMTPSSRHLGNFAGMAGGGDGEIVVGAEMIVLVFQFGSSTAR